ncbi:complex I NDUFA9 subunit family protein [Halovivax cerinus]|uniref:Complex I NDUFA9 subunit family protein n=1 Tax=Halovivax cerinus TaxID=1487865 RepID=A0ABD5NJI0_9EURY|nr:complex I NDUFA9 subunit family protein [Halovivax cerinus]
MNILVAGGTGFIGSALCKELADRGHDVTAMARHPDDETLPTGVEAVAGDATDPESARTAVDDHDVVVNLVALSPLFQTSKGVSQASVHVGATTALVEAAENEAVDRFVQLSAIEADTDAPTSHLRAKGRGEAIVRESAVESIVVRPSVVFGAGDEFTSFIGATTVPYLTPLPAGGRTRFQPLWIGDLAPLLAECVLEARGDETYELAGPEVLTLADVTRQYYAARNRWVRIVPVPMVLSKLGLSLAGPIPFVPFGIEQARGLTVDNTTSRNAVDEFGVEPASLRTFREYLDAES